MTSDEVEALKITLNAAYRERAEVAAAFARQVPWPAWVGTDPAEPDWPVLYVETPAGQVSWHFAPSDTDLTQWFPLNIDPSKNGLVWDGHTPTDRTARLLALTKPTATEEITP